MFASRHSIWRRLWLAMPVLLLVVVVAPLSAVEERFWNFMPSREIGAQSLRAANPAYDGRGVIIAILDTGVDANTPGLQLTASGQTKLIDVRDFSSEGLWETSLAERDETGTEAGLVYRHADGLALHGAESLAVPPLVAEEATYPVYFGLITESHFEDNAGVNDLNDDGDTDDSFGFIVYAASLEKAERELGLGQGYEMMLGLNDVARATVTRARQAQRVWLVVVDTDGDGDLADEKQLRDYRINYDHFSLSNPNAAEARDVMAWELNVIANEDQLGNAEAPSLEFHFDSGSHGSHCAGIASGFEVLGQKGMHGAAPGAWLMSLKIGDNRLSGGSTRTEGMKRAFEYAASFEEDYGIPVVVNLSYGISSVQEGDDAMGTYLNQMLAENPTLYVCTSAGNAGPGLSTVGLPATSYSVISAGAYISPAMGADLYSAELKQATLFNFSARGGDSNKPDIVAPGSALSTVPGFNDGSGRFNGTSMASPQTAGGVACLVSAAATENLPIHWGMMKRAIIAGGAPVPGLTLTDQGGGLVQIEASWELLQKMAASEAAQKVLWYKIQTDNPFQSDGRGEAAYWRTPGGTPFAPRRITFSVKPVFHPDLSPDDRDEFFRSFKLRSEADWLHVVSGDSYIRGDRALTVACTYDGDKMHEPGLYSGRIIGSLDGGDLGGLAAREFYLWNTVVIGEEFGPEAGFSRTFTGRDLAQSSVHRYYVNVPAGASAMRVRLEVSDDVGSQDGAGVLTEICDPSGKVRGGFAGYARKSGDQIKDMTVLAPDLFPGTWEINVATSMANLDLSSYQLTVSFDGYEIDGADLEIVNRSANGEPAVGEITVTRTFPGVFEGTVVAKMSGFTKSIAVTVEDADTWTHSFTLDRANPTVRFHLEMSKEVGNLFTDCVLKIMDESGVAVVSTGFNGLEGDISYTLPDNTESGTFSVMVVGAFAIAADSAEWGFEVDEKYEFAAPIQGSVETASGGQLKLYAGISATLEVSFADSWPAAPEGMHTYGTLIFRDTQTEDRRPGDDGGRVVLRVPLSGS